MVYKYMRKGNKPVEIPVHIADDMVNTPYPTRFHIQIPQYVY